MWNRLGDDRIARSPDSRGRPGLGLVKRQPANLVKQVGALRVLMPSFPDLSSIQWVKSAGGKVQRVTGICRIRSRSVPIVLLFYTPRPGRLQWVFPRLSRKEPTRARHRPGRAGALPQDVFRSLAGPAGSMPCGASDLGPSPRQKRPPERKVGPGGAVRRSPAARGRHDQLGIAKGLNQGYDIAASKSLSVCSEMMRPPRTREAGRWRRHVKRIRAPRFVGRRDSRDSQSGLGRIAALSPDRAERARSGRARGRSRWACGAP
jgi:hypothetical protein